MGRKAGGKSEREGEPAAVQTGRRGGSGKKKDDEGVHGRAAKKQRREGGEEKGKQSPQVQKEKEQKEEEVKVVGVAAAGKKDTKKTGKAQDGVVDHKDRHGSRRWSKWRAELRLKVSDWQHSLQQPSATALNAPAATSTTTESKGDVAQQLPERFAVSTAVKTVIPSDIQTLLHRSAMLRAQQEQQRAGVPATSSSLRPVANAKGVEVNPPALLTTHTCTIDEYDQDEDQAVPLGVKEGYDWPVGLTFHGDTLLHRARLGEEEFERPERISTTVRHLSAMGLLDRCSRIEAPEASDEDLLRIHSCNHLSFVDNTGLYSEFWTEAPQDLYFSRGSGRAARLAAGAVVAAAHEVAHGRLRHAFAITRPPGHHCSATAARGFCFYNNVAVAVRSVQAEHPNIKKVMIIDWDVHHCDGTEEIFYDDPNVLVFSVHQFGFKNGHRLHCDRDNEEMNTAEEALEEDRERERQKILRREQRKQERMRKEKLRRLQEVQEMAQQHQQQQNKNAAEDPLVNDVTAAGGEDNGEKDVAELDEDAVAALLDCCSSLSREQGEEELVAAVSGTLDEDVVALAAKVKAEEQQQQQEQTSYSANRARRRPPKMWTDDELFGTDAQIVGDSGEIKETDGCPRQQTPSGTSATPPAEGDKGKYADVTDDDALRFFGYNPMAGKKRNNTGSLGSDKSFDGSHTGSTDEEGDEEEELAAAEVEYGEAPSQAEWNVDRDAPFYPATGYSCKYGDGPGDGYNVNFPWPTTGFGDLEYMMVMEEVVAPMALEFQPDMIFVSCGFDCAEADLLGSMRVTPSGFYMMTKLVTQLCDRVVMALEGGYNLSKVATGAEAVLRALLERSIGSAPDLDDHRMLLHQCQAQINETRQGLRDRGWKCFQQ